MISEVKIPSPGESITEVLLARWFVADGDQVDSDQELGEVESDKATLPLISGSAGAISIAVPEGSTVKVGTIACRIDSEKAGKTKEKPAVAVGTKVETTTVAPLKPEVEIKPQARKEKPAPEPAPAAPPKEVAEPEGVKVTPLARKMMEENNLSVKDILDGLQKITTREVELVMNQPPQGYVKPEVTASRNTERQKLSPLRKKLAERLVTVKNETAMLTTFNEVDMSVVMGLRKKYQSRFEAKYGIKLGFMSFFAKAATEALKLHPMVNSQMEGDEIVTPSYYDIGIAVSTDKGLMVPILRNVETMSLADIEKNIAALAAKARSGRISLDEMSGGTFTITNGGVFGSMLSTPIINPPQSAILGMHNIVERPVVVDGKIEVRPVMYLALSYDHRIIDGRDSVSFLVKVKQFIENPVKLLFGASLPEETLLDI
jgi:2-oxoglutarate dehydrogenase E2 component (dihydrolipoamide succinyltransferase)